MKKFLMIGLSLFVLLSMSACDDSSGTTPATTNPGEEYTPPSGTVEDNPGQQSGIFTTTLDGVSKTWYTTKTDSLYNGATMSSNTADLDRKVDGSITVTIVAKYYLVGSSESSSDTFLWGIRFENEDALTTGTLTSATMINYDVGEEQYNNAWQSGSVPFTAHDIEITSISDDGTNLHVVGHLDNFTLTEQDTVIDKDISITFDFTATDFSYN